MERPGQREGGPAPCSWSVCLLGYLEPFPHGEDSLRRAGTEPWRCPCGGIDAAHAATAFR